VAPDNKGKAKTRHSHVVNEYVGNNEKCRGRKNKRVDPAVLDEQRKRRNSGRGLHDCTKIPAPIRSECRRHHAEIEKIAWVRQDFRLGLQRLPDEAIPTCGVEPPARKENQGGNS